MTVHERNVSGGRVVSLEVWGGLWVVIVTRDYPRFVDILSMDEFVSQDDARKAYRRVK